MKTLCTAVVTVHGGREGHAVSTDGLLDVDLMSPAAMGRPGDSGTNPEQLFAAAYAAGFESALRREARALAKPLKAVRITAQVSLLRDDDQQHQHRITLQDK